MNLWPNELRPLLAAPCQLSIQCYAWTTKQPHYYRSNDVDDDDDDDDDDVNITAV